MFNFVYIYIYIYIHIAAWWLCTEYLLYYIADCLLHGCRKRLKCRWGSNVMGMIPWYFSAF